MGKVNFVTKFIESIIDISQTMRVEWNSHPIYYKGFRVNGYDYKRFNKGLINLKDRGLIVPKGAGNFAFTSRGRRWFDGSLLKYWRFRNIKWDKKWRVIIFDIPQELHNKRNIFRQRLKSLGFYMIQKSVFVFPYPCEDELSEYCKKIKINDYINILLTDNLGYVDKEVKKVFNL